MSKALQGAAMLGGAIAMGAAAFFDPALIASPLFDKVMFSLALGGLSMEAGAIAGALTSNRGMNITTRQPAAYRQYIYGTQRVGGTMVYCSTTGSTHNQYNMIIVIAGHEIDSIVNLWLDGRLVHWQVGSPGNTTRNGINFGGNASTADYYDQGHNKYSFRNLVYCEARYGDQAAGDYIGAVTANDPNWAPTSQGIPTLQGCAYVYLKCEYSQQQFPQFPEVRFTVRGKNDIYDPRTGTTGYTANWALCAADVFTNTEFGLGDVGSVNQAQLIAAANVCDEQVALAAGGGLTEARYTCNATFDGSVAPGDILSQMMPAAAGRISRIGGEWYIWPAYWQGPSFSFDESSLVSTPEWNPYRSYRDLFNRVKGTYTAPNYPYQVAGDLYDGNGFWDNTVQNNFSFEWQKTDYPAYMQDTLHGYAADQFLIEDGGVEAWKETPQACCISVATCQRVAKIELLRNRQQGSGTFSMFLNAYRMQPVDVMNFAFKKFGWVDKYLEIVGVRFSVKPRQGKKAPQLYVEVDVQETDPSVYEWSASEELSALDQPSSLTFYQYQVAPPTTLTLDSGAGIALAGADGVVTPRVEVEWTAPLDAYVTQIQVQYQPSGASTWTDAGLVDVANFAMFVTGVVANGVYVFRIRSVRPGGAVSDWVTSSPYTVSISVSNIVTIGAAPGTLVGEAQSGGTASILVEPFSLTFNSVTVNYLTAGEYAINGLNQAQGYYVYFVDPNLAGGAITPVATQNTADFIGRVGYFEIGYIVTPVYVASGGGGGGGGGAGTRYAPSSFSDIGSRTTTNPAAAYDGNTSTDAVVSGVIRQSGAFGGDPTITIGDCIWEGFPSVTLTAAATLNITATIQNLHGATCTIDVTVSGTTTNLLTTTSGAASHTYTMTIPSGTNLSSVTIEVTVDPSTDASVLPGPGSVVHSANFNGFEIWIQT